MIATEDHSGIALLTMSDSFDGDIRVEVPEIHLGHGKAACAEAILLAPGESSQPHNECRTSGSRDPQFCNWDRV